MIDMTKYTTAGLHAKVGNALREFFCKDDDLLCRDVNERSVTHKLAEHLQRQFKGLKVDCEYNRYGDDDPKKLVVEPGSTQTDCVDAKTVYPDIIVHERGSNCNNLLVIEVKKTSGRDASYDKRKLRKFTDQVPHGKYKYDYTLGLFLVFDVDNKVLESVECFQCGKKIKPCCCCGSLVEKFGSSR